MERTDQQPHQHSPDAATLADCHLCAISRHPSQAKNRRELAAHLKTNPLPRQAVGA